MQLQIPTLQDPIPGVAYTILGIAAVTVVAKLCKGPNLGAIPTVGPSSWFESWWGGHKFQTNAKEIIREGYEKYKSAPFKVLDRYRWIVVLGRIEHMEELRKAPDDALSLIADLRHLTQAKYTIGPELVRNSYHNDIVRSHLARDLGSLYPKMRDEASVAFDEVLNLKDNEWKAVYAFTTIQQVVCRTSNRIFVGLPLCRDPDWININLRFTLEVAKGARAIQRFPGFLAPLVAHFVTESPRTVKCAMKHLAPMIEERLKLAEEHGNDWAGKPNDLLTWLLDEAPGDVERTVKALTMRVLTINFAAIRTTSNSFTHALFFLAENPQYIQPLREEVESIVEEEGWSVAALQKMRKVDSFLKESQRLVGSSVVSLRRMALKDFTFLDGTFIPKGTSIVAPALCLHLDDKHYDNPNVFDPFRFSDMPNEEGEATGHQLISTSNEYLSFGHGKHACTGRFFAATELKTMLAHVVMSYDVKLEGNETRPKGLYHGVIVSSNPMAKVMFRRRVR